jgi:hypothetical protein
VLKGERWSVTNNTIYGHGQVKKMIAPTVKKHIDIIAALAQIPCHGSAMKLTIQMR